MGSTYYVDCVTPRTTAAVWTADTVKALGNRVWSTSLTAASAKYIYEATDIGSAPNKTHATTEPTWPTTVGNTVVDADITWTCRAPDSWDEALPGIQGAADLAVAGDIVYCRGSQTITATIDFDTQSGTNAGGFIKFIGTNSSGTVDGTRFIMTGGGTLSANAVNFAATAKMLWFSNIEVKSTNSGAYNGFNFSTSGSGGCVFINCCANNCGQYGFHNQRNSSGLYFRCMAYQNSTGFYYAYNTLLCSAFSNTTDGFAVINGMFVGNISHDNTDDGLDNVQPASVIMNCVIDSNGDDGIAIGASTSDQSVCLIGNRITNHSGTDDNGLYTNSEPVILGHNVFDTNKDHVDYGSTDLINLIFLEGTTTDSNEYNNEDGGGGGNTNQGYAAAVSSHNFATGYVSGSDPEIRRQAITVPWQAI